MIKDIIIHNETALRPNTPDHGPLSLTDPGGNSNFLGYF